MTHFAPRLLSPRAHRGSVQSLNRSYRRRYPFDSVPRPARLSFYFPRAEMRSIRYADECGRYRSDTRTAVIESDIGLTF